MANLGLFELYLTSVLNQQLTVSIYDVLVGLRSTSQRFALTNSKNDPSGLAQAARAEFVLVIGHSIDGSHERASTIISNDG